MCSKAAQKDIEAKWVVKFKAGKDGKNDIAIPQFGYKNYINIDQEYGFIRNFAVTNAAIYDGHMLEEILDLSNLAPLKIKIFVKILGKIISKNLSAQRCT